MTMNWFVGYGNARFDGVCRHAFLNSYGLAHASLDRICSAVKKGILNAGENFYNDNSNFALSRTDSKIDETTIRKYSMQNDLNLTTLQFVSLKIPNNRQNLDTYGFMHQYFSLMGDKQPNRNDEIHLEPCTVTSIYEEYVNDMKLISNSDTCMAFSTFTKF